MAAIFLHGAGKYTRWRPFFPDAGMFKIYDMAKSLPATQGEERLRKRRARQLRTWEMEPILPGPKKRVFNTCIIYHKKSTFLGSV
jgi:hypothetical protein